MLVVDFLHEFELGVWKATFIHIIRILYAAVPGGKAVVLLNTRWGLISITSTTYFSNLILQVSTNSNFWS
jgi:hypothetical protein